MKLPRFVNFQNLLGAFALTLAMANAARALEPICQNNPNVIFCDDAETGDFSLWGHGPAFDSDPPTGLFPSTDKPFLGNYSLKFNYHEFGAPSYEWFDFPAGTQEIRVRFYLYLDALYHWGMGSEGPGVDHTFSMYSGGGTTCTGSPGGFDFGATDALVYRPGTESCMNRQDLHLNMGTLDDRTLRNGRWHRIEFHFKLNTVNGCVDKNANGYFDALGECDGVYEAWYDGKQVMGYYDVNMRSTDAGYYIGGFLYNHYYRTGGQAFNGKTFAEYRDNLVVLSGSNGGNQIGPVANEPPLGTADMTSPYSTIIYKDWFAFDATGMMIRPGVDCAGSLLGGNGPNDWYDNSGEFLFVTSPAHNQVQAPCAVASDMAVSARTFLGHQFAGGGIDGPLNMGYPNGTHVLNGWMFIDPANYPPPNGAAFSGFIRYGNTGRNYIAMGVDSSGHPTLLQQTNVDSDNPPTVLAKNSNMTLTAGVWHQFEVRASLAGLASVLIDGVQAAGATGVNVADIVNEPGGWGFHYGISDHMNNPNAVRAYFDEISMGNTSFQDCFGWDASACPFNGTPPRSDTIPPSAPRNLILR